jgi:PD-(D/E)XK nuclease superfamily
MPVTRLFSTAFVVEQWHALAGPWLREQAGAAWKNRKPTVILTPTRAEGFYLRSRLVEEGVPFLGLRFWTPSDARKFLHAEIALQISAATQAELRLLARTCGEKLADQSSEDNPTIKSVIREPSPFLRAYDLLLAAGWNPAREGAIYGRELAMTMQRALEKSKIATQAGLHQKLWQTVSSSHEPLIANLLLIGFNAAHWPLWDLLKAAVFSAEQSIIALSDPRVFAEEIDQLWNSSWEDVTKSESISPIRPLRPSVEEQPTAPFENLVASYEKGARPQLTEADLTLLATPDLALHIRAVALQALDYLRRESCTRLGIVFPEANALALGVAEELRRLGLPLDDSTGSLTPGLFEQRCWRTWIALQEEPGVERLIAWARACEADGISCGLDAAIKARDLAKFLGNGLGESLVDDLNFLEIHIAESMKGSEVGLVAEFLRKRVTLPEKTSFAQFLETTRRALELPGWENHLGRLKIDPPAWLGEFREPVSRHTFLEWLREATDSQTRTRGTDGNHFYGKVHLLIAAQMSGQTWSHLILTGLNEGVWPRIYEAGAFGSRHELTALNRQARTLNELGKAQGGQGMGHDVVAADHGHCLLPLERQDLALRDLCAALEATSHAACLTAMTTEAGRSLLPSDFFNHAYQTKTGAVLDDDAFRGLAEATRDWLRKQQPLSAVGAKAQLEQHSLFEPSIAATQVAYAARRNRSQPFGPYEFAFAQPPPKPIQLWCKRWDDALNHPATVWLGEMVGTSPWPEGELSWPRAVGTWVHRWLAGALRECRQRNSAEDFLSLLLAEANREVSAVRRRAKAAHVDLYPWWTQVWGQARTIALGLGDTLMPRLQEMQFLAEFRLPDNLIVALPGCDHADFVLKGRIDLLLVEPGNTPRDLNHGDFSGCTCWVIDFKTGSAQNLASKKSGEGKGLQAILYALAIRACGAISTTISLHTADAPLKAQTNLDEVTKATTLFRSLDKLHREGVFGMRPDADNAYGYSPAYPMATRFIPSNILEAKWALVHGAAAEEESE